MATRDDGCWRSEVTDLLLDAEHREELQRVRVGVWAFQHVAASEATGQIAAVLNAVASAAASEWVWRLVDLGAARGVPGGALSAGPFCGVQGRSKTSDLTGGPTTLSS